MEDLKDLKSNLKTTTHTKYGPTRQISITDSIRQGGILSVTLYALLMDEINKDMEGSDLGIKFPETNIRIPCLLWMGDVVLGETDPKKSQDQLDKTNHTSQKYHVEFGMPSTKYIRSGRTKKTYRAKARGQNS